MAHENNFVLVVVEKESERHAQQAICSSDQGSHGVCRVNRRTFNTLQREGKLTARDFFLLTLAVAAVATTVHVVWSRMKDGAAISRSRQKCHTFSSCLAELNWTGLEKRGTPTGVLPLICLFFNGIYY
eukprot:scpid25460/ scgid25906/ 